ncbi:YdcF family protein [Blastochloris viridis]|uniref:Putative membrane protein n=1 Tax=Blastochloris viridis TaxID=1079 RepID=A0A0H5BID8_BLAVI|nr:YdcF family protein [Blastochloris viridis]ALK09214.1 hypothetical protein BVIR_1430 [Blastochloris viridis]BAS00920.1 putative membrane protein [Blastochloris viridis]CUU41877.1 hypothetical protein BVIRIDIS_08750 [Blastochloris viridis]
MDAFFLISKLIGFVVSPANALILLLLLGVATLRWRFGRRLAALATVLLVVCGLSPLANVLLAPLEQRFPRWDAGRGLPDGIVVLGGAIDNAAFARTGDLALNEAAERMTDAVALARAYPAARLVFVGGSSGLVDSGATEADAARAFFARMGVAPERIEVEDRSRNTVENAAFTKALVQPKLGERWLLVTSAWHMPRAIGCFRAAGFATEAYPVDFRLPGQGTLWPFFFVSDGLRRLDLASREWIGLASYYATGRIDTLFPAP